MKILIYGSEGWIGKQIINYLDNINIEYIKGLSRVDNIEQLEKEIINVNPTHVLSLIGRTHGKIDNKDYPTIDYLEQEGKLVENIRDNLYSPLNLALITQKHYIHFTYLGTGCIFDYDDEHPFGQEINGFTEKSLPNFFGSSYSIVKGFTDRIMHMFPILNLRIRMPINSDNNPRNFITKIINYDKICNISNSMSVLPELIPIIIDLMRNHYKGTVNLTNPGLVSHNEILEMYREIVDPDFEWVNFSIEEQNNILESKRSNNYLDTSLLQKLYPNVKNIKDSIRDCLVNYPKLKKEKVNYYFPNNYSTNLLITNGFSYIGSNFINYIFDTHHKINIYNIDTNTENLEENCIKSEIVNSKRYKLIKGNTYSEDLINYILNEFNINYVVNFATKLKDNILETYILLESCRKYNKIIKFIHVSNDEIYNDINIESNNTELSIYSMNYSKPKFGAELVAHTYYNSFKMPIIIIKSNNVYNLEQYSEISTPSNLEQIEDNIKHVEKIEEEFEEKKEQIMQQNIDIINNIIRIEELGIEYFNIYMYRCFNRDLNYMTDEQLVEHFKTHGYYEKRLYTLDLPDDFDPNEYKNLNSDLSNLNDFELKVHYILHKDSENRKYKI